MPRRPRRINLISEKLVKDDSIYHLKVESEAGTWLGPEEITRDIPNVSEDLQGPHDRHMG